MLKVFKGATNNSPRVLLPYVEGISHLMACTVKAILFQILDKSRNFKIKKIHQGREMQQVRNEGIIFIMTQMC